MKYVDTDGVRFKVPELSDPISLIASCEVCGMPVNYNPLDEKRFDNLKSHVNFHQTVIDLIKATVKHEISKQKP